MEGPMLFSTEMVQGILNKLKKMTRRLNGLDEVNKNPDDWTLISFGINPQNYIVATFKHKALNKYAVIKCPYGKPGDKIWVRETWRPKSAWSGSYRGCEIEFKAGGENKILDSEVLAVPSQKTPWRPSIHMPRVACRIHLKITDIRVERLQDITADDVMAEGVKLSCKHEGYICSAYPCNFKKTAACKEHWQELWDGINKSRGYGWDSNPWVWVISFERIQL